MVRCTIYIYFAANRPYGHRSFATDFQTSAYLKGRDRIILTVRRLRKVNGAGFGLLRSIADGGEFIAQAAIVARARARYFANYFGVRAARISSPTRV